MDIFLFLLDFSDSGSFLGLMSMKHSDSLFHLNAQNAVKQLYSNVNNLQKQLKVVSSKVFLFETQK